MVEFLPGFSASEGTKPGDFLDNEDFSLAFSEVLFNDKKSAIVSRGLESMYDWTTVINIILDSLKNFEDTERSEVLAMEDVKRWLRTYQGWGLLVILLPRNINIKFQRSLREMKENWPQDQEYTEEKCWIAFTQDKQLEDLIPELKIVISDGDGKGRERRINLRFDTARWNLEVKFVAEKLRPIASLVNTAGAVVAQHFDDSEVIKHLEIPVTLRSYVAKMMGDIRWMSSFRKRRWHQ